MMRIRIILISCMEVLEPTWITSQPVSTGSTAKLQLGQLAVYNQLGEPLILAATN